jgi:hypothetical protein
MLFPPLPPFPAKGGQVGAAVSLPGSVGETVVVIEGLLVGAIEGVLVGETVSSDVGSNDGSRLGSNVGAIVGKAVGTFGAPEGADVG